MPRVAKRFSPLPAHRIATRHYPLHEQPIERLGEWLVRRGLINRVELFNALDAAFRHGCRLGDALVWLDVLERDVLESEVRRFATFANRRDTGNIPARSSKG